MSDELKPCNYCEDGGEPRIIKDGLFYVVGCNECGYTTGAYCTKESAVAAWNDRADWSYQTCTSPDSGGRSMTCEIKIGNEVYVHGYVDEIRNDTVIIRNDGGYFGTAPHEVMPDVANVCADDVPEQLQVIKNAESYKLADDSGPQVIAASEKHELADSRERLEADVREICWGHAFYRYDAQKRYLDERGLDVRDDIVTTNYDGHVLATVIIHMLDRQDAITRREFDGECEFCQSEVARLQNHVDALEAEVETQRKMANDAERGVLSEEWYVCRDRYEDDIAELTAELRDCDENRIEFKAQRDFLQQRVDGLTAELDKANESGGKLFDKLIDMTAERDEQRKRKATAEQKLNALVNRLREQRVGLLWNDGISDWHVSLPIEDFAEVKAQRDELRERLDRIAAEFDDDDWDTMADGKELQDCPMAQFQPKDGDSRSKLEADVADIVGAEPLYATIIDWLDRQAAITRAEVFEDGEYDCMTCAGKAELREQFDELTAENIRLQADMDEKQHVCDVQRESFRKMEQLLADAKAADYTAMRDEIEKLGKQVAKLEAENRDLCTKIYGAPF